MALVDDGNTEDWGAGGYRSNTPHIKCKDYREKVKLPSSFSLIRTTTAAAFSASKGKEDAPAPAFSEERLENEKCKFASFSFSPLFLPLLPSPLSTAAAVIMIPRLFVPPQTTTVEPKFALPSLPHSLSPAYDKESDIITKLEELLLSTSRKIICRVL